MVTAGVAPDRCRRPEGMVEARTHHGARQGSSPRRDECSQPGLTTGRCRRWTDDVARPAGRQSPIRAMRRILRTCQPGNAHPSPRHPPAPVAGVPAIAPPNGVAGFRVRTRPSTPCSWARSTRPHASSTRTARWSTCSTPTPDVLRFAFDAGIRSVRSRRWVRRIELPIGTGMFGRAVADRAVVKTDDYANDAAFPHSPDADKVVEDVGHPLDGRRADGQRRRGVRRARHVLHSDRCVRPRPDRTRSLARRPRGRGHGQCAPHRRPRSVAPRALQARRDRAQPARDRGTDQQRLATSIRSSSGPSTRRAG